MLVKLDKLGQSSSIWPVPGGVGVGVGVGVVGNLAKI